ncbi:MAG: class I SAM-dependent DNA methyltransferase [Fibrobacter sp.]|nr:class I SAM-dependent DNA methyltransferase [Fibrobacter sp.]
MLTPKEQQRAAKKFSTTWKNKGYEKGECQKFWCDLLCNVFGVKDFSEFIRFEDKVLLDHAAFADGYIPSTKVLIEQKSIDKDLNEPIKQSDGSFLDPFEQARRYIIGRKFSEHPRWIVTCNFKSFFVYDMDNLEKPHEEILLENIEKEYNRLSFLVNNENIHLNKEFEVSVKAGDIIGKIYDLILAQYHDAKDPSPATLKSLNMLCVRLVFCLYAEDAGIFGSKSIFGDYLSQFDAKHLRNALLELFHVLDQDPNKGERDEYLDPALAAFPYVNGGLFTEEDATIPQLTEEIKDLLVKHASNDFDWSDISPTIFGAIFESTLNPETRREGGMHYTSIENIHKVIDPLFLDDLKNEFNTIKSSPTRKDQLKKISLFQDKLHLLRFFDPACGSGNFLTETYLCLRRLENECLKIVFDDHTRFDIFDDSLFVSIHQFYGIEINDFATVVAKTALWIAENQMLAETSNIIQKDLDSLPLKSYANIIEGNALTTDWNAVVKKDELTYIIGNPPFVGASKCNATQKSEIVNLFGKIKLSNSMDYVAGWYYKAAEFIQNTNIKCALVSTNSISQGEQVAPIWRTLLDKFNIQIDYAYRTFRWDSESNLKAHVHCVIIGFSVNHSEDNSNKRTKKIYLKDGSIIEAKNICPYLIDSYNFLIDSRGKPLCDVPEIRLGNKATGKGFILSAEERTQILKKDPSVERFIKQYVGADEYINGTIRYCLWLKDSTPADRTKPVILKQLEKVKEYRQKSTAEETRKKADTPHLFFFISQPTEEYILIPSTSSENRQYVPMGFVSPDIIASNATSIISNASLYHFGILSSNVHMAWMRVIGGRMKSDYRYTGNVVYNTFPWPNPTSKQQKRIEETAQMILDARAKYPESCLADQYNEIGMSEELRKAHKENDKAVMAAYGFSDKDFSDTKCVIKLYELYADLISNELESKHPKKETKKRKK